MTRTLLAGATAVVAMACLATPGPAGAQIAQQRTSAKAEKEKNNAKSHKLVIQVDENKPEIMSLALNNATNVLEYYKGLGEKVSIEIVTFGPGLHMLRDDTSPVKARIAELALQQPDITYAACSNTQMNMSKREEKPIILITEAKVVPSGVVRLMELQKKGYAYVRP